MRRFPLAALTALLALALQLAACDRKAEAPAVPSVAALQADPILLSRVLGRCNDNPSSATTPECINARAAVDRQTANEDAAREKKAEAGFEKAREARRRADEAAREAHEATEKRVSPYELPVEGEGRKPGDSPP